MVCTELGDWFKKTSKHSQQGIGRYRAGPMAWGPGRTTRQLQEAPYPFEIINCFAEGGGRLLHTFLQALAPRNITSTDDFQDKAWEKFNDWMFYFHPHLHDPNQAHPETSLGNIITDHWMYQQLLEEGFEVLQGSDGEPIIPLEETTRPCFLRLILPKGIELAKNIEIIPPPPPTGGFPPPPANSPSVPAASSTGGTIIKTTPPGEFPTLPQTGHLSESLPTTQFPPAANSSIIPLAPLPIENGPSTHYNYTFRGHTPPPSPPSSSSA
uniref:Uncharacterized protein n=1 Tax=Chromera velia CCMP2878 TaxID=1169474 RepID=A0A0G4GGK9_9ALVE|eukprot:Cvel_4682.t1-p1 / transcript=Cvel_4682.t1 / gene=Cvel_4682 / organism=Chromera_velia_CCMP2878 / gene_product=hypothetical protein / transcript_product=hypothetical protein / location=Cvel_scaffold207:60616-61416(+) / protein_length=267 / sequence_SO=supercontig / SO=protein_coding / is_pseudo=false